MIILFFTTLPAHAEEVQSVNYFPILTQEETEEIIKQYNANSCDELTEKYFNPENLHNLEKGKILDPELTSIIFKAMAYDTGLCVEQDLEKAVMFYEQSGVSGFPMIILTIRIALIYSNGPEIVKNDEKAEFYFKQTAIYYHDFEKHGQGQEIMHTIIKSNPAPKELTQAITWYQEATNKSYEERKELAQHLKTQGFQGTDNLWYELEEIERKKKFNTLTP
ncbi:MAG: hypothetical protein OEY94_06470 [Alphaproteobacteria bacterium]|nr:hypothetical protein [Alphaproteobacteria bacterium]